MAYTETTQLPYDAESRMWSIMTKSRGGVVSVIRDLTEDQARKTYERLNPRYGEHSEVFTIHQDFLTNGEYSSNRSFGGSSYTICNDSDIVIREVFGPNGWEWFKEVETWPKLYFIYTDDKWNVLPDKYQQHPKRAEPIRMKQRSDADKQSKANTPKPDTPKAARAMNPTLIIYISLALLPLMIVGGIIAKMMGWDVL